MIPEPRYSDVLSESQIARMGGNSEGRREGIADGLRMAAEMLRERRWKAFKDGVPITDVEVYSRIIAKAKEVEEGK